jgi:hypothetical protein
VESTTVAVQVPLMVGTDPATPATATLSLSPGLTLLSGVAAARVTTVGFATLLLVIENAASC